MKLSILIPCYNEPATIAMVVARSLSAPLPTGWEREVIVIDDGSDDATRGALRQIPPSSALKLIHRRRNGGKGAALKSGLEAAEGEYLVIQDADLEYDPVEYARLLAPILEHRADAVFGSRNRGNNNVPLSSTYFYGGLLVTKLFNLLFTTRLTDLATCYKLFPRSYVGALLRAPHDDFAFDCVDLPLVMLRWGTIAEVPISYRARTKEDGKKLDWKHGLRIVGAIVLARLGVFTAREEKRIYRVGKFLAAGAIATAVNVTVLYLLVQLGALWYIAAEVVAYLLAFAANFFLQKYWVFESPEFHKVRRQLPLHLLANVGNLALTTALLYMFVEYGHLWYVFAQIVVSALIAVESFFVYRWIFH